MDAVTGLRLVRDRMRQLGHEVVEVPGWETRGQGSVIRPSGAVNHWTAGPATGDAPSLRICTYGREGLRNALCNSYSSRHPRLYIVAARVAWHAGAGAWPGLDGNRELGHEAECSGPGGWSRGQLALVDDLDRVQADVFGYPLANVIDHFEWAPTRKVDCRDVGGPIRRTRLADGTPLDGEEMAVTTREDVRYYQGILASKFPAPHAKAGPPYDIGPIDGIVGPKTRAALEDWQRRRGIAVTGTLTVTTCVTLQSHANRAHATDAARKALTAHLDTAPHGGSVDTSGFAEKGHTHEATVTVR